MLQTQRQTASQGSDIDITKLKRSVLGLIYFKNLPKMRISEKCHNNNSDNPLTSRHTDGGKYATRVLELDMNSRISSKA